MEQDSLSIPPRI